MALKVYNALISINGYVKLKDNWFYALRMGPDFNTNIVGTEITNYPGRYLFDIDYTKHYRLWSGSSAGTATEDKSFAGVSTEGVLLIAEDIGYNWQVISMTGNWKWVFKAGSPMLIVGVEEVNAGAGAGGILTIEKALSATPTSYVAAGGFPISLATGDKLRLSNAGYTTGERSVTVHRGF